MKFLKRLTFTIVILYLFAVMVTYSLQRSLIFYPEKLRQDFKFDLQGDQEEIFIQTTDGETINGLYYPGERPETILYFHGNAGSLKDWQYVAADFVALGYSFCIIDYRGYGKSTGDITEEGLYQDAEAAFEFLMDNKKTTSDQIIIYGRSIGTGVAAELASRHKTRGLIFEAPFTSLKKLANEKMPFLLPSLFLKFYFNTIEKLVAIQSPILFIHGSDDSLIPPSHTEVLFNQFGGKKDKVIIPHGTHNDLSAFAEYQEVLKEKISVFF